MNDFTQIQQIDPLPDLHDSELKIWRWLLGTGVVVILLGLAAIFLPFVATMAIEILIAMILLITGATQAVHAFKSQRPKGFTFRLLYSFRFKPQQTTVLSNI
jgi:uncharacterized membrane protein HdeD (DUF308 family)